MTTTAGTADAEFTQFLAELYAPDPRPYESPCSISYTQYGAESAMLRSAIRAGMTNENLLANVVFFDRHRERDGRLISRDKDGPDFRKLSVEWLCIRDTQVRPILPGRRPGQPSPTPPPPTRPAPDPDGYGPHEIGRYVAMPRVTAFRFRNADGTTSDPTNCCAICPTALGVGRNGTASNGMELRFTIDGHRPGMEYDITRTRRDSLWQRRAGAWASLGSNPMGTRDDHHDTDECLSPRGGRLIFAVDMPGWPNLALPSPAVGLGGGTLWPGGRHGRGRSGHRRAVQLRRVGDRPEPCRRHSLDPACAPTAP